MPLPQGPDGLDIVAFASVGELRSWLTQAGPTHAAVWVRVFTGRADVPSVTFAELLEEGIAFGWSESTRKSYDEVSYLQRFGPRRSRGTASPRNVAIAERLDVEGRLTDQGRRALGW
ncbi:YdeI/OmpD-associated family protein [Frondihabitans australicus]|uniref:Uncharacterized protein n=1 Tax=Frondihabitans australicus TaxID=386892 RepID=A0A495IJJ8_9MICO|nr:hypothetical protein [Frondihabitans australicus]RKR75295.1 hypothetical protein C8E83_2434 [Frondihabitans australicus]